MADKKKDLAAEYPNLTSEELKEYRELDEQLEATYQSMEQACNTASSYVGQIIEKHGIELSDKDADSLKEGEDTFLLQTFLNNHTRFGKDCIGQVRVVIHNPKYKWSSGGLIDFTLTFPVDGDVEFEYRSSGGGDATKYSTPLEILEMQSRVNIAAADIAKSVIVNPSTLIDQLKKYKELSDESAKQSIPLRKLKSLNEKRALERAKSKFMGEIVRPTSDEIEQLLDDEVNWRIRVVTGIANDDTQKFNFSNHLIERNVDASGRVRYSHTDIDSRSASSNTSRKSKEALREMLQDMVMVNGKPVQQVRDLPGCNDHYRAIQIPYNEMPDFVEKMTVKKGRKLKA